jgi:hypothetical protein
MKTELQKQLAKIAPHLSIATHWSHDPDSGPISKECDGFDESADYEWQAWNSNVRVMAIHDGEEIEGNAYLGGTWEKVGDSPDVSNPDISGYENQMTAEALEELAKQTGDETLQNQIEAALAHCEEQARISYEAQRAEIESAKMAVA